MRETLRAALLATAVMVTLALPAAAQPGDDCRIVIIIYDNSVKIGGVCQATGRICVNFYEECNGQPVPPPEALLTTDRGAGHLNTPRMSVDGPGVPVAGAVQLTRAASSCETRGLFERLDRRRLHLQEAMEPEQVVHSPLVTPAAP